MALAWMFWIWDGVVLGLRMGLMGSDANLGDIGPDYYCEWSIVTVHRPFIGRCGFLCSEESGKGWKVV